MRRSEERSVGSEASPDPRGGCYYVLDPLGLLAWLRWDTFGLHHVPGSHGWVARRDVLRALTELGFFDPDRLAATLVEANDAGVPWAEMAQIVEQWPRRAA